MNEKYIHQRFFFKIIREKTSRECIIKRTFML